MRHEHFWDHFRGRRAHREDDGDGHRGRHRHGRHGHDRDHDGRGGGRRERVFDQGTFRLVLLRLIAEAPRHGYELIKAVEERTGGGYSPSPGTVYPTLTLLEEMGHASVTEEEGGRRRYQATEAGRAVLAENAAVLEEADARMLRAQARHDQPQVRRATDNFRAALKLRLSRVPVSETEIARITAVIDDAARAIEQV